ncbi:MAG: putative DNA-binding domain-containing protein [Gammaproteobacteria bacterium]|nr:putative DNA-binding domain-containing protein [Gammaproteobacteria bacterium]
MAIESFTEIQRQFTKHLRDPDNAAPPAGADPRRMRIYARFYRAKLVRLLERVMSPLTEALGRDELFALIDDYVRLPRVALGGKSSLEESFADYIKEVSAGRGLRPFIPELADFCVRTIAILDSIREIREDGIEPNGDLLRGVPVFSELAEVMAYEWPVHRIGAKFLPEARPVQQTWLVVYRDRRGAGGYVELNGLAATIALRVRDNAVGKTGQEILADTAKGSFHHETSSLMRAGLDVLEALRQRDIIIGVRTGPA